MYVERYNLGGDDWQFKDFLGEDWIWRDSEKPDTRDVRWWRQGTVPGTILHDVWKNGEVQDPYFERNSMLSEWVPARTWIYKKSFRAAPEWKGRRIRLHFKGVDYAAQFFLNGVKIGEHEGMYTAAQFEVSDSLKYGEDNLLAVVIEKAPDEQPQVSKTRYVRTHKSRMTYWWDFCPRMIHQGIWEDVFLEMTGPAAIEDVYVQTSLSSDLAEADISVSGVISSNALTSVRIEGRIKEAVSGTVVGVFESEHAAAASGLTRFDHSIHLGLPKLWQPNGSGESHQYEAEVRVLEVTSSGERLSDQRVKKFGIRKIEWAKNKTPDETALPYTFVVNGQKTYIKGWNWVPIDVMYGVERQRKLERLIRLAYEAGVNMLRVWGGGLIEKDAFYELCSRYGIMVWQEFIQSSSGIANAPSEDPDFIQMMTEQAEQIVPRKRNHASLVLWCGGNELQADDGLPLDDSHPVLAALKSVVERLQPDALWLATSPTGRIFGNTLENIAKDPNGLHDVHGPWEHQGLTAQYELYNSGTSLLHSEFGVEGMTRLKTLNRTISKEQQWPASKDNPVYFHRGAWWTNEPTVQTCFGREIEDVATLIRASQMLQAEGLRYAVESNRRRIWQNSGTLPWQFNEPYPNAYCTSALDYYAYPKPVYYGIARAYRSAAITASFAAQAWQGQSVFSADIWAVSDSASLSGSMQASAKIVDAAGRLITESSFQAVHPANTSQKLGRIQAALSDIQTDLFFLDLQWIDGNGELVASNRYLFTRNSDLSALLTLPPSELELSLVLDQNGKAGLTIRNHGANSVIGLQFDDGRDVEAEGYVYFSDNDFILLPGETKVVQVEWTDVAANEQAIEYSAWNEGLRKPIKLKLGDSHV